MASIEESLVALVQATPALTTVLGVAPTRFYPDRRPQGATLPTTAYQRISTPMQAMSHRGPSNLSTTRFQLTTWAGSAASRNVVVAALRQLLGYKGTVAGLRIDGIMPGPRRTEFEPTTQEYISYFDILITHQES